MVDAVKVDTENSTTPEQTQSRVISNRSLQKGKHVISEKAKQLARVAIEYVPINQVYPNAYNPNRQSDHDFEMLLRSIEEDGFTTPIVVNKDGIIVDGEHRWRAAQALGFTEIPVVYVDMDDVQMRLSTIRHNRARGSHDVELEGEIMRDLQQLGALDWAKDSLLLDDTEMNRLLNDIEAPEALAGQEYTQAWIPGDFTDEEKQLIESGKGTEATTFVNARGDNVIAMTKGAVETQHRREELLKKAKTEQERQQALKDAFVFRVSVMFTGEEGKVVKQVLGEHPADVLLQLCKDKANAAQPS